MIKYSNDEIRALPKITIKIAADVAAYFFMVKKLLKATLFRVYSFMRFS